MIEDLISPLVELIKKASTSLPQDIETVLLEAMLGEQVGTPAYFALQSIIKNVKMARESSIPICQDTGTPIFYVQYPNEYSAKEISLAIRSAVSMATEKLYFRPNAVDTISGTNSGCNLGGKYFPVIHFKEGEDDNLHIHLLLKGGGCENVSRQYALPDESLQAERDLEGVRKVALDAVYEAQGFGCSPGFLGIAIGGDRGTGYMASKEVFLNDMNGHHSDDEIAALESRITNDANQLQIGPMGFGGKTTILGTRIVGLHRLPASYYVTISYMCWALRRSHMKYSNGSVSIN